MRLSMWMLSDRIKDLAPKTLIQRGGRVLRNARLLAYSQEYARTTLYLQQNDPSTVMCMNGHDIIVVGSNDIDMVLNSILDIFDRLAEWSDEADELIRNGCSLDDLLAHATLEAHMHLMVSDANYLIHAFAPFGITTDDNLAEALEHRSLALEDILFIDGQPKVRSADAGIYFVDVPKVAAACPVGNIFLDGIHQGWLIGARNSGEYSQGDLDTLDMVLEKVCAWMRFNGEHEHHHEQTGIFARLLEETSVEQREIDRAMDVFSWRSQDRLRVFAVARPAGQVKSPLVAERFLASLNANAYVVRMDDGFAMIVNASLAAEAELRGKIKRIITLCGFSAGTSPTFSELAGLRRQYDAALIAAASAHVGEIVDFENIKMDYAVSLIRTHAVADVRHAALALLTRYDAEHETELYETLRTFVSNRGCFTDTYKQLFIHRSTLSYRLDRIAALANIDLNDERTWEHIAFSFLMEKHSEKDNSDKANQETRD